MTNEFDVLKRALAEHETALKMKHLNQQLMEYLTGSIYYITKYSEENNIPLPNKENLLKMIEEANSMIENIVSTANNRSFSPSTERKHDKEYRQGNTTCVKELYTCRDTS